MLYSANPRLKGYVYRRKKRCGKPNCRCAKDAKYRHTVYQLQYRDLGKQRSEHVPKNKVGALRARIKKAKRRDRELREIVKDFLARNPRLVKCSDIEAIGEVIPHLFLSQAVKVYSSLVKMPRSPCLRHCWGEDFCPYVLQLLILQQQTQKQIEKMLN